MSFSAGVNAAYGAYHAMNYKRPRLEDDTMTGQSFSQQTTAVKKMASVPSHVKQFKRHERGLVLILR